jgi:hypothetical protein
MLPLAVKVKASHTRKTPPLPNLSAYGSVVRQLMDLRRWDGGCWGCIYESVNASMLVSVILAFWESKGDRDNTLVCKNRNGFPELIVQNVCRIFPQITSRFSIQRSTHSELISLILSIQTSESTEDRNYKDDLYCTLFDSRGVGAKAQSNELYWVTTELLQHFRL